MSNKPHLRLLSKKQLSEVQTFKYNYGFGKDEEKIDNVNKNYLILATSLKGDTERFSRDIEEKYDLKDVSLGIPKDIDFIEITFLGSFDISKYFDIYYQEFGLEATTFYNFAKIGLFAVINTDRFKSFLNNINNLILLELENKQDVKYNSLIKYISGFKLLRTNDILKFPLGEIGGIVYLSLIDLPLDGNIKQQIVSSLIKYLQTSAILYQYDEVNERIELKSPTQEQLLKIAQNFDIIESITSSAFTIVRPGEFNTAQRLFGFDIFNAAEDLPLVGIIDTGISQHTSLSPLIINDTSFTLAGNPLIDEAGRNRLGHGTAVAGLVALGKHNHKNNFEGTVTADAKLLSIKISNNGNGFISEVDLIKMLYDVKAKYPAIRLFTLTTCYSKSMAENESFSDYTYLLDKFAYETNSLIFICTGNNINCINENTGYDLSYFHDEKTNLSTPADSLNNITIGAAADNLKGGAFLGIADGREFPTLYTRKGHIDLSIIFNSKKVNKNYFKPDVIESGGDMGYYNANTLDWMDEPALTLLSARPEFGVMSEVGTSFAAPLVANLAAKIVKNYPTISNESVKALIINSASSENIPFSQNVYKLKNRVIGNGLVSDFKSLYSTENSVTLILEDAIENGRIRIYPINFPKYLLEDDLGRKRGILKITATLCFKFLPIKNNQLSYNPIHMAFSIFRNHSAEDIMKSDEEIRSKLKTNLSWSQNGRYISKPLPYSNTQKVSLNVNVDNLENESNTFKLAIHAKLSEQIIGGVSESYPNTFPFSIVLTIEETIKNNTGKLYDEIQLVNFLEVIQETDAELDVNSLNI